VRGVIVMMRVIHGSAQGLLWSRPWGPRIDTYTR